MNHLDILKKRHPKLSKCIKESNKIWFGQYPYKITFDKKTTGLQLSYWLGHRFGFPPPLSKTKFKIRNGWKNVTLYFEDFEDLKKIIVDFEKSVEHVTAVTSLEASNLLATDGKIRLKKKLYFNKYRYKITFKPTWHMSKTTIVDMQEWINDNFEIFDPKILLEVLMTVKNKNYRGFSFKELLAGDYRQRAFVTKFRNGRVYFRWAQIEPTLFLSDETDLTLVKLAWGEYFNNIEVIQLIDELEEKHES